MKKSKKGAQGFIKVTAIILLIAGLAVFLYPHYLRLTFNHKADQAVQSFEQTPNGDYDRLYADMVKYNRELYENGQNRLTDQYSYTKPDINLKDYSIEGNIVATIRIDKIGIQLPVLNGASEENMLNGAVYLANTSFPIPTDNSNCVIAAHNVWRGVNIFRYITKLEPGDKVIVKNFWQTLEYTVCDNKIILPDESEYIYIQPDKRLLTLSTCYPFPQKHQRYLVYAELTGVTNNQNGASASNLTTK